MKLLGICFVWATILTLKTNCITYVKIVLGKSTRFCLAYAFESNLINFDKISY